MQLYNTLSRRKETFKPLTPGKVGLYACGVTVYDDCHLGHARSCVAFEVLVRYLRRRGLAVTWVRNFTDIDDKILRRAQETGADWKEVAERYIDSFQEDMTALGVPPAQIEPKATEHIPQILDLIRRLEDLGFAYGRQGGDVFFRVRRFPGYGKLSGQKVEDMESGARIEVDPNKEDPLDFVLWKASKPGEPAWDSPWGPGRPGWHIECSAMSMEYLGETFDLHGGGQDLVFPHHENELAQSEAATGKPFARFWLHHGLLTINGQKMSKSLGNFVTVGDFINKYQDADLLKLFFLSAHYAHPIDYTGQKITEAKQALERIAILFDKVTRSQGHKVTGRNFSEIETLKERFIAAMDDDFNTPQALACIFELVNIANKRIEDGDFTASAKDTLLELASLFGLSLGKDAQPEKLSVEIAALIQARNAARKNGNFQEADALRKQLESAGIILEDTKGGATTWRRKL